MLDNYYVFRGRNILSRVSESHKTVFVSAVILKSHSFICIENPPYIKHILTLKNAIVCLLRYILIFE